MRRIHLVTLLALPLANALSLANFQRITSILVPVKCLDTYNSQIDDCGVTDFNVECSRRCQRSLTRLGEDVAEDCSGVILNPNSLLGIVKAGNIITALCPQGGGSSTTPPPQTSTVPPKQTTTPPPNPPVTTTGSLQTLTTSTVRNTPSIVLSSTQTASNPATTSTTEASSSRSSSTEPATLPPSSTTLDTTAVQSTPTFGDVTDISSTPAATTTPAADRGGNSNGNGSGGGSPFDIVSGASNIGRGRELTALVLGAWAVIMLWR